MVTLKVNKKKAKIKNTSKMKKKIDVKTIKNITFNFGVVFSDEGEEGCKKVMSSEDI